MVGVAGNVPWTGHPFKLGQLFIADFLILALSRALLKLAFFDLFVRNGGYSQGRVSSRLLCRAVDYAARDVVAEFISPIHQ